MTLEQMEECIRVIRQRYPNSRLVRNQVGNLAIMSQENQFLGWIEITEATVHWDDES